MKKNKIDYDIGKIVHTKHYRKAIFKDDFLMMDKDFVGIEIDMGDLKSILKDTKYEDYELSFIGGNIRANHAGFYIMEEMAMNAASRVEFVKTLTEVFKDINVVKNPLFKNLIHVYLKWGGECDNVKQTFSHISAVKYKDKKVKKTSKQRVN